VSGRRLLRDFSVDIINITFTLKGHLRKWKGDILSSYELIYQVPLLYTGNSHIINSNFVRIVHTKFIRH